MRPTGLRATTTGTVDWTGPSSLTRSTPGLSPVGVERYHSRATTTGHSRTWIGLIELDPEYAWAIAHRGGIYQLKGDYDRALMDLDRAVALAVDDPFIIAARGWIYPDSGVRFTRQGPMLRWRTPGRQMMF